MDICINNVVSQYIKKKVEQEEREIELGGILLGYRSEKEIHVVQAIDIPSLQACDHSYSLDGNYATAVCNKSTLDFVGIWHSHVNEYDSFSKTDVCVNSSLAIEFGGIISVLAIKCKNDVTAILKWSYIDEKGTSFISGELQSDCSCFRCESARERNSCV